MSTWPQNQFIIGVKHHLFYMQTVVKTGRFCLFELVQGPLKKIFGKTFQLIFGYIVSSDK